MGKQKKHWTEEMFVEKSDLWLYLMDLGWKNAPRIARQIRKVLKKYRITKGRILEIGCGNGRITTNLAKLGFNTVGVDISPVYIEDAKKKAARLGVTPRFLQGDIRKIDRLVRGKFDVVISIWTSLGYYDQRTDQALFKKVAGLLKKKGVFLILVTMSRERLLDIFNERIFQDNDRFVVLDEHVIEWARSITHNKWVFYRKKGKDLMYEDEITFTLHIYSIPEYVDMAESAGMALKDAFHSILTLEPTRSYSPANLVFQKK
jgi:2-polyprenyl-3-methyl-5-hydroxy-6-metoxy-1,4-benzoquinol methylase